MVELVPDNLKAILATIAFTGMRSGECQRLRVEDVDLAEGWIHIRSRAGLETKTGNDWQVPIHPALKSILLECTTKSSGYFFTEPPSRKYPDGDNWINMKRFNERFQILLRSQGIAAGRNGGGYTVHDLRHAYKSICVSQGVPREYVDLWQGHAAVNAASDLYFHAFDGDSQQHIRKVPFGHAKPAADDGTRDILRRTG